MAVDATFISPWRFSLEGDRTAEFKVDQRLFAFCGEDGAKAVTILNISYSLGLTRVLISGDRLTNQLDAITYQREEELAQELVWEGASEPPDYFRGILWVDTTVDTTTTTSTTTTSTTTTTTTSVPYSLYLNFDEFPFVDDSTNEFIITNAGVTRSAVQSVSGGYSGFFDGTATGYITVEDDPVWDFGSDDFRLDLWIWPTTLVGNGDIITRRDSEIVRGFVLNRLATQFRFYATSNDSTWDLCNGLVIGTATQDAWNHVVVERIGNDYYTYLDDTPGAGTSSALAITDQSVLHIGSAKGAANTRFTGYLDRLIIER